MIPFFIGALTFLNLLFHFRKNLSLETSDCRRMFEVRTMALMHSGL